MSMKAKILELLREKKDRVAAGAPESEAYVSGQELCEQFGVSRTAIWKAIGQLKKEGYVIEAVQNRGYRLLDQTEEVYNQADIQSRLKTKWVAHPLLFFDSIDSTNIRAKHPDVKTGFFIGLCTDADVSHGTGGGEGHPADTAPRQRRGSSQGRHQVAQRSGAEPEKALRHPDGAGMGGGERRILLRHHRRGDQRQSASAFPAVS